MAAWYLPILCASIIALCAIIDAPLTDLGLAQRNRPWLALDAAGNPRIGYNAEHWWYGVELSGGGARQCNDQDITVMRLAAFAQPAP